MMLLLFSPSQLRFPSPFRLEDLAYFFAHLEKMAVSVTWGDKGHTDGHPGGAFEARDVDDGDVQSLCRVRYTLEILT